MGRAGTGVHALARGSAPRLVGVALLCGLAPGVAHAQVWVGDFETGDLSQFSGSNNATVGGRDYIQIITDPVAEGAHAARIELHDDAGATLRRVELQHEPASGRTADGHTLFFAWSFLVPDTLPTDPAHGIGYWESRNSWQQTLSFSLAGEDLTFTTRHPGYVEQWRGVGAVTPGVWHRIALRVLWSRTAGEVDLYFDGEKVVDSAPAETLGDDNPVFVQFGLIRDAIDIMSVPVILVDDAVEGDTLAEVAPERLPGAVAAGDGGVAGASDGGAAIGLDGGADGDDGGASVPPRDGGGGAADGAAETGSGDGGCAVARTRSGPRLVAGRLLASGLCLLVVRRARRGCALSPRARQRFVGAGRPRRARSGP